MTTFNDKPLDRDIREMFSREVSISEKHGSAARDAKTGRLKSEGDSQLGPRLRRVLRGKNGR
jgi:hypothetical protein